MPPANSPVEGPFTSNVRPEPAATPLSLAEEAANDENVTFLRSSISQLQGNQGSNSRAHRRPYLDPTTFEARRERVEADSQRWMRRALLESRRSATQPIQVPNSHTSAPVEVRDSTADGGYRGWAPGTFVAEAQVQPLTIADLRAMARGHTRSSQSNATRRHTREQGSPSSDSRAHVRDPVEREHSRGGIEEEPLIIESSLRSTALLQSVRRQARFAQRSAGVDTIRSTQEAAVIRDEQAEHWMNPPDRQPSARVWRDPLDEIRRGTYGRHRNPNETECLEKANGWLEEAIKYLERLRSCDTHSERISSATAGGFIQGDYLTHQDCEDFILDTKDIKPPARSSWLRVGGVFSGSQHAASNAVLPSYQLSATSHPRRIPASSGTSGTTTTTAPALSLHRSWVNNIISQTAAENPTDDTWPVKVTINSVDCDNMTLTGTMEAFNVPNKSMPGQESSITTFLEGEIIDFNRFTLETKSFNADARVDSTYWRKLEPFRSLKDGELVSKLLSTRWLCEELGRKWILMRWKEKCFVTPSDAGLGLTISGFYYVSLRREDGRVEGLYYDPLSSPYQHLQLMAEKRQFPAYQFQ